MWTKVAKTNVAWTNVPVTVGICYQEPTCKVSSKWGQKQLRQDYVALMSKTIDLYQDKNYFSQVILFE